MEIAKFVFTAIGTFLSVFSLSFAVFQYWRKKQDEKFDLLKSSIKEMVRGESNDRKESESHLRQRLEKIEDALSQRFESRLSEMGGQLKGIQLTLQSINNWFIHNDTGRT